MSAVFLYIFSILAGLVSFGLYNVGFALEKMATNAIVQKFGIDKGKDYFILLIRNRRWQIGFLLTLFSVLFYFLALLHAPLTVVAPMVGFGLIVLVLFAHYMMKESIKMNEGILFTLIISTVTAISIIGAKYTTTPSWGELLGFLNSVENKIFLAVILMALMASLILYLFRTFNTLFFTFIASLCAGIQGIVIKFFTISMTSKQNLITVSVLLISIGLSALGSTVFLQLAFKKGKVTFVMTVYNAMSCLIPILFGVIVMKEWEIFTTFEKFVASITTVTVFLALMLLSIIHWKENNIIKRPEY